jgi:uncharacterized protein YodC (DUF2158 family)
MYTQVSRQETEQFERRAIVAALGWLCDPLRTMENFQVGDVVQLKSGGPSMTVYEVSRDGSLFCQWFDNGAVKGQSFKAQQLQPVAPQDRSGGSDYVVGQR